MRTAWAVKFSISVIKLTLVLLHLHSAHHLPPHFHCNHSLFLLKRRINKHQRRMLLRHDLELCFWAFSLNYKLSRNWNLKVTCCTGRLKGGKISTHIIQNRVQIRGQLLYTHSPFPVTDCIGFAKLTYFHNLKQIRLNPQRNPNLTAPPPAEGFFKKTFR